jgi:hypothetical protein
MPVLNTNATGIRAAPERLLSRIRPESNVPGIMNRAKLAKKSSVGKGAKSPCKGPTMIRQTRPRSSNELAREFRGPVKPSLPRSSLRFFSLSSCSLVSFWISGTLLRTLSCLARLPNYNCSCSVTVRRRVYKTET